MDNKGRGAYKHGERAPSKWQQMSAKTVPTTGQTLLILAAILFLAFLLRSIFAYGPAIDNGFAVSGGSDAVYYERIIEYILNTGQQLLVEPLQNYPHEAKNLREPLFAWAVVMGGMLLSMFGIPIDTGVGASLMFSTPVFGTLAIIPVYLIARDAFSNRVGLIAAALMAVSSGAISLTVLSDADHDAMAMFFILWSFYFLMRALEKVRGMEWVQSWSSSASVSQGLRSYARENRVSLLLALMSGMCMAIAAMTWKGFVFALVIVTMFLIVQLLIDRFSNRDSMGLTMVYTVMGFSTVILSMPYYFGMNQVSGWWDLPLYIVIGGTAVAMYFTFTRDKPWTLTLPGFALISAVGVVFLYLFMPAQFNLLVTGAGFFGGTSKLYGTIAEAQAPSFSSMATSFGWVTTLLAFIGAIWAAGQIPRFRQPFYVFIVIWVIVAILMASNAQRFIFNSSMAFAIAAAVTLNIILVKVDIRSYWKNLSNAEWRSKWRLALKPVPLVTVLALTFLVAAPNVWVAFDAAIPNNTKADYDQEIYDGLPSFLKPDDYSYGNIYFLGSTGYRITTDDNWYYSNAWDWLSQQDTDTLPEEDRPAYLSWWDYGFEASHYADHPTVADNFQRGYQMAAAFITAQSEAEAIALLVVRILETDAFSDDVNAILTSHGVDAAELEERVHNPSAFVSTILNHPDVYGRYSSDLSAANARYIASSHYLTEELDTSGLASLYHDLRAETGHDIGYFAIDTRLFPWSFDNMGIFSAPALLGDHVMDQFGIPADFYEIYAVVDDQYIPLEEVSRGMQVTDYALLYKENLYESMMWRTFMGFNPGDLGLTQQGIPGTAGSLRDYESMQGWGLNHFRMVYRTAMYNPFDDYQQHSDAWTYISYDQAQELKEAIAAGDATGVVQDNTAALQSGVVFLQYYDGVEVSGTVTTEYGDPLEDVYVTVYDEYGIPHMMEETDADGNYSVYAPFGESYVTFSTGEYDKRQMRGETVLEANEYDFSYSEAMREDDAVVAASAGHQVTGDVTIPSATVRGSLLLDDEGMEGADVRFVTDNLTRNTTAAADGSYELSGLVPTTGRLVIDYQGHELSNSSLTLSLGDTRTVDLDLSSATVNAVLEDEKGDILRNVQVELTDVDTGEVTELSSDTAGVASFTGLLPGRYSMSLSDSNLTVGPVEFLLDEGESKDITLTVMDAMTLSGVTSADGAAVGNVTLTFSSPTVTMHTMSDEDGNYSIVLPEGEYTVHAHGIHAEREHVSLHVVDGTDAPYHNMTMAPSAVLRGQVSEGGASLILTADDGAVLKATASNVGYYRFAVPAGDYSLLATTDDKARWIDVTVSDTKTRDMILQSGATVSGVIGYDINDDGTISGSEALKASVRVLDAAQRSFVIMSNEDGSYSFTVPEGNLVMEVSKDHYASESVDLMSISGSVDRDVNLLPENITVSGNLSGAATVNFVAASDGAVSKSVTASGTYSVELRPGDYDVSVWQNVVSGNDTVRYKHDSTLTVPIGSDAIVHDVDLTRMIKTDISNVSADDEVRVSGLDGTLTGETSYTRYLEEGNHSFYAVSDTHSYLALHDIDEDNHNVAIDWQPTSVLNGELRHDGAQLTEAEGDLVVTISGAEMPFVVRGGEYSVDLPPGTYGLEFTYDTVENQRYYRYSDSTSVTISGDTVKHLDLDRSLHNVTVNYTVTDNVSADISFIAESASAVDATVNGATGSVMLAPGDYSVYAVKDDKVFLDTLAVEAFEDRDLTIDLEQGYDLVGTFKASGGGVQANATVTDGDATVPLDVDAVGYFDIYLPEGYYDIIAEASVEERTVMVDYSADVGVSLRSNTNLPVEMVRDDLPSASLSYDGSERTIAAGNTFTVSFTVFNDGNTNETVTLSSNGWPMTFSSNGFTLPFGHGNLRTVTATVSVPEAATVEHGDVNVVAHDADGNLLGDMTLGVNVIAEPSVALSYGGAGSASNQHYDYEVLLQNDGNVRSTLSLSVNEDELSSLGWSVSLLDDSGNVLSEKQLSGYDETTVTVRLTPIAGISQAQPVVTLTAASSQSFDTLTFTGSLPDVMVAGDEVNVSGNDVFADAGGIGMTTWVLLALTISSITLFILMGTTRGVFTRRKR